MPFWRSTRWFESFRAGALGGSSARELCCPRRVWWVLIALGACSAPDGSDLFTPLELVDNAAAGTGSLGGSGAEPPDPGVGLAGRGGSINEGQGGSTFGFAGAGGASGESNGSGGVGSGGLDAGLQEPPPDADVAPDAAPEPPDPPDPPVCVPDTEVCDGLDNDCDEQADEGATCPGPCEGFVLEGGSYMFCAENVNRTTALNRCAAEGMRLAWLETPEENAALLPLILAADVNFPAGNPDLLTQIGATDSGGEGEWRWVGNAVLGNDVAPDGFQFWEGGAANVGGEVVNGAYVDWSNNEPNNSNNEDCAAMTVLGNNANNRDPGEWDDRLCNLQLPYLCETP